MADELFILWTNADEVAFEMMVVMYARNSLLKHWWDKVTLIVWGNTANLAVSSSVVREGIRQLKEAGVTVTACKSCADRLGVTRRRGRGAAAPGRPRGAAHRRVAPAHRDPHGRRERHRQDDDHRQDRLAPQGARQDPRDGGRRHLPRRRRRAAQRVVTARGLRDREAGRGQRPLRPSSSTAWPRRARAAPTWCSSTRQAACTRK